MQFYENFCNACKLRDISPSALLIKLGKSKSTITQWKNGSMPSIEIIPVIADALGVSIDYLLTGKESDNTLSDDERYLIDLFRKASFKEQMKFIGKLEEAIKINSPMLEIKCSEYRVSAGLGEQLNDYDSWKTIEIPDTPNARKADFALIVSGDSIIPMYNNNDIILVKSSDVVDLGEIAVFIIEGEGYIKKFGGDRLISINSDYDDILFKHYDADSIRCVGRVIGRA